MSDRAPVLTRHLNLAGASNFRDLGGYSARGGRLTQWRRLFRSNHLGHLTEDDIAVLRELGLKSAFDLRGVDERLPALCRYDGIAVHSLPIEPVTLAVLRERLVTGKPLRAEETAEIMRDSYRNYVRHNTESYRTLFTHLLDDSAPLVIHCTAGKDRTGFAAALILKALGVSDELIIEDYLLTNRFYKRVELGTSSDFPDEVRTVLGSVEASFLAAALDAIRTDYGDLEAYFEAGLGVGPRERAMLDQRYLDS
ncbi:tyrosine-protein phosphatase [Bradyrhizobium sp. LHD-71]|uniref:tyrosine-protein phosphatase n=1 Tax=Bradyrhizobium sp. LHD-71 TaxID=3072141 RepID=UPI00280EA028|nr:tyrosine-protein phosphatase [Bradyrhizobium sp. LHD-71]MDQ8729033.1 tyrosine-protein phosphatase [Bradyrhizobium sp. LHD-71]